MRRMLLALTAVSMCATLATAQSPDGRPAAPTRPAVLDTTRYLVLPFTIHGQSLDWLSAGISDMLHWAIDGIGGTRIVVAPTMRRLALDVAGESGVASAPSRLQQALVLARSAGAGRLITGTVTAIGTQVRLGVDVYDARSGRRMYPLRSQATLQELDAAVDSIAARLLARRLVPASERRRLQNGEFETRSPAALQAYLVARTHWLRAERADRRAAIDSLNSALRQDSTFGRAYLLLHRVASADIGLGVNARDVVRAARPHTQKFPARVRTELAIVSANAEGNRHRGFALAREAAVRYPDDPDFAFRYADAYFHFGINLGEPIANAIHAFERAMAFDDQDPELLNHAPSIFQMAGDPETARRYRRRCEGAGACGAPERDVAGLAIAGMSIDRATAVDTLYVPPVSFPHTENADVGRMLWVLDTLSALQTRTNRASARRIDAYFVRSMVAITRGQPRRAWAMLDSSAALGQPWTPSRFLFRVVTGDHDEGVPKQWNVSNLGVMLVAGWWAAVVLPADSAEAVLRTLPQRPWPDSVMGEATATALRGILALRAGDTTRAIDALTRTRGNTMRGPFTRSASPGVWLSLKLAELLAARGDAVGARMALADLYPRNYYMPFVGDAEELRARVALMTGDTTGAVRALETMVAVWSDADAHLQPRVQAARAQLASLRARRDAVRRE